MDYLTDNHFSQLMMAFEPSLPMGTPIAVGLSGGPDSRCLTFLLSRWGKKRGHPVVALIVDHGLRPESPQEARATKDFAASLGLKSHILTWHHHPENGRVSTRVQERARDARYALMIKAAHEQGIPTLCLAHHLDDQIETFFMRLSHQSGVDGLGGMSPQRSRDNVFFIRPLLSIPKASLLATLRHYNIPWIDDPSNQKQDFERVRWRHALASCIPPHMMPPHHIATTMHKIRESVTGMEWLMAKACSSWITHVHEWGYTMWTPDREAPTDVVRRSLISALATLRPIGRHPIRYQSIDSALKIIMSPHPRSFTLGGCLFTPHGHSWWIMIENRHSDFLKIHRPTHPPFSHGVVAPLGDHGWQQLKQKINDLDMHFHTPHGLMPFVLRCHQPALWDGKTCLGVWIGKEFIYRGSEDIILIHDQNLS